MSRDRIDDPAEASAFALRGIQASLEQIAETLDLYLALQSALVSANRHRTAERTGIEDFDLPVIEVQRLIADVSPGPGRPR